MSDTASNSLDSARANILDEVRAFAGQSLQAQPFVPGESVVPVSGKVLDAADYVNLVDACLDGWLTAGRFTEEFER